MSNFAVGALYSSQKFLHMVREQAIIGEAFSASYQRFEVADAQVILELVQQCGWVSVRSDGVLQLTERGLVIAGHANAELCLRAQIADLIAIENPSWAKRILLGRYEAKKIMPRPVVQCFDECGLFVGTDAEVVEWWDSAAQSVRAKKSGVFMAIGRAAERMTVIYERNRTGTEPKWQSIETNVSGFDVLSKRDADIPDLLKIEVKGSTMRTKEATFLLTRNEWQTAQNSDSYCFHLWLFQEQPKLLVVDGPDLSAHVPANQGEGQWETATIRFRNFVDKEVSLSEDDKNNFRFIWDQLAAA